MLHPCDDNEHLSFGKCPKSCKLSTHLLQWTHAWRALKSDMLNEAVWNFAIMSSIDKCGKLGRNAIKRTYFKGSKQVIPYTCFWLKSVNHLWMMFFLSTANRNSRMLHCGLSHIYKTWHMSAYWVWMPDLDVFYSTRVANDTLLKSKHAELGCVPSDLWPATALFIVNNIRVPLLDVCISSAHNHIHLWMSWILCYLQ